MALGTKLTSLSACAGCAAKLPQDTLLQILHTLPASPPDPNLLVGTAHADDAAVYRLGPECALVQTVDFFTPIVDDPFAFGQIAAANAISDVYAMGGKPLTALSILGFPADVLPPATIAEILRGGQLKAAEAGCLIVGGHTIRLPEPVYGLAVTGTISPKGVMANTGAQPGDCLVLTKPLGTGVITTAIKRGLASESLAGKAIELMTTLNRAGFEVARKHNVNAATDVTGFGLLGHLANICRASEVGAIIDPRCIPVISSEVLDLIDQDCIPGGSRKNLETANKFTEWGRASRRIKHLVTDAQTSGGLLFCVNPKEVDQLLRLLQDLGTPCTAVIGRLTQPGKNSLICFQEGASDNANGNRHSRSFGRKTAQASKREPAIAAGR